MSPPGRSLPCLRLCLTVLACKTQRVSSSACVPKTRSQSKARGVLLTAEGCGVQGVPVPLREVVQHLRKVELAQITFPSLLPKLLPSLQSLVWDKPQNHPLLGPWVLCAAGSFWKTAGHHSLRGGCFVDHVSSSPSTP